MKSISKRLCALGTTIVLLMSVAACSNDAVTNNTEMHTNTAFVPDEDAVIEESVPEKNGTYASTDTQRSYLERMTLQIENDRLALYLGEYYDIAVLDKATGKIFFSNESIYTAGENVREELKANLYSQVSLVYYDSDSKSKPYTLSSYPDCFKEDTPQIEVTKESNTLRVLYKLGKKTEDMLIIQAMRKDTHTELSKKAEQLLQTKELSRVTYGYFINGYTHLVLDTLSEAERKEYLEKYPMLDKFGELYILKPTLTDVQKRQLEKVCEALGVTKDMISDEAEFIGELDNLSAGVAYYEIPVTYRLQGGDLTATIETASISDSQDFFLTQMTLLQGFGASVEDDGYLFIPDGSGSIIENNTELADITEWTVPFYGDDFALDRSSLSDVAPASVFPVFGIREKQTAVFGIVESGDAMAGAVAHVNSVVMPYNTVYPYFNYYTGDLYDYEGKASVPTTTVFSSRKPATPYSVRYHFLYGEQASYSGMAEYYQKYLLNTEQLNATDSQGGLSFDLSLLGSINVKEAVCGIPLTVKKAATTFEEAAAISEELKHEGIPSADIRYRGVMNGGIDSATPARVKFQKELGGIGGYQALEKSLARLDYSLFTNVDFLKFSVSGNGFTYVKRVSKFLNKDTAVLSRYDPATLERMPSRTQYLIAPQQYSDLAEDFLETYSNVGVERLYIEGIGTYLSGNYDEEGELTRQEVLTLTRQLLKKLSDAGYKLKADTGSLYVLPYVDALANVPVDSSHSRLEAYSIPFVGMVFKSVIDYSGPFLNQAENYQVVLLKNIESGAGLNYQMFATDPLVIANTEYIDFYSLSADYWIKQAAETYKKIENDLKELTEQRMVKHEVLFRNVNCVTYENGYSIVFNYNTTSVKVDGAVVEALSYRVFPKNK